MFYWFVKRNSLGIIAIATMLAVCLVTVIMLARGAPKAYAQSTSDRSGLVRQGRYLTHHVAMCVKCHSPRDRSGELIESKEFEGGVIPVESPFPDTQWAFEAPRITGLGSHSAEDIVTLLTTGAMPDGWTPRPPMPPFRMSQEDAKAVVAYLSSLR